MNYILIVIGKLLFYLFIYYILKEESKKHLLNIKFSVFLKNLNKINK